MSHAHTHTEERTENVEVDVTVGPGESRTSNKAIYLIISSFHVEGMIATSSTGETSL